MADQAESYEPGKIFVGGLSWDTGIDGFKKHFQKYGEIVDAKIMEDQNTQKPRGFGFVTFKDQKSVEDVLMEPTHIIDNKKVDPKQATLKPSTMSNKKVFVGGLPIDAKEDDIKDAFRRHNLNASNVDIKTEKLEVQNGTMSKDKTRSRGFGFVDFVTEEDTLKAVSMRYIEINHKNVEIKKAEPRTKGKTTSAYAPDSIAQNYNPAGYLPYRTGYAGGSSTPSGPHYQPYYPTYPPQPTGYSGYGQGFGQHNQYPQYDYSAYSRNYAGQQHMPTYPQDATAYTQQTRTTYGTATDQYTTGIPGFGYDHTAYSYTDQSAATGVPYGSTRATAQQRSGFSYSARN